MEGIKSSFGKSPSPESAHATKRRQHQEEDDEQRLILLQNRNDPMSNSFSTSFAAADPKPDLIVKIDSGDTSSKLPTSKPPLQTSTAAPAKGGDHKIWRGSSYDFLHDGLEAGATNKKTQASGDSSSSSDDDDSVEFDFQRHKGKLEEADLESQSLSPVSESPEEYGRMTPRETKLSLKEAELVQRRRSSADIQRGDGLGGGEGVSGPEAEVVKCSANSSFQRKSTFLMSKTKSRLIDPPDIFERSGMIKRSGLLGATKNGEEEEDDPFWDDDLPDAYKKTKFSCLGLMELVSLVVIIVAVVCSLVFPYFKGKTLWGMQIWKWGVMLLVLICGGLVSGWLIRIVVFFIERNFLLRKRVLYFVYGLKKAVQNCLWLGWVLLAWSLILDKKVERKTHSKYLAYVTKILVCLLVGTIIWLFKTLLVKVLAMSFHVSAFFDRIQESLFNQYVIETLSGPPLIELQKIQEEEDRVMSEVQKLQNAGANIPADLRANCLPNNNSGGTGVNQGSARSNASGAQKSPYVGKTPRSAKKSPRFSTGFSGKEAAEEAGISIDHLHRLNQKNISAWNMKRLMNHVRNGVLSTLDEQLMTDGVEDENSLEIRSEKQAKAAAKRIFNNVARPGSRHIRVEDLMRFMREDEAAKTIRSLEASTDSKGISKKVLKNWVVNVFRERRALALSLNDTKTAVNKLHHLLNVLVGMGVVIIWLMILGVPITHFLVFISSQLLLLTFVFGNTFKTTFEAIIFLFVMHPYDVGDRCEIEGVQMVVEEMNILTTVFLRYDNQKIIYPNSVLATKQIANYYRSPHMGDAVDFCVHISTPVEKLSTMKEKITKYIDNKSDHWYPDPMIVMRDVEDMNRIKFSVWVSHTMNHQDMGERWVRRARLVEEMVSIFRELDIEYRMLPMDMNVRNLPSWTSDRVPSNWLSCSR